MPIIFAFATAVLWGFGNVFQKQGMTTSFPKISLRGVFGQIPTIIKTLLRNWLWMLGTLMMLCGAGLYVAALGVGGEVTVVQPILCLTVVVSALVGVIWLKERVSILEWVGIATVFAGVVVVSVVKGGAESRAPETSAAVLFFGVVIGMAGAAFLMGKIGISNEFSLALSAGLMFGLANVSVALLTLHMNALPSGAPVSPDILNARDSLESAGLQYFLEKHLFALVVALKHLFALVVALFGAFPIYGVIVFNILGSVFYQTAFANGRASIVASVCTIIGNTVPIVAAIVILGETVRPLHGVGIAVVLLGAVVLAVGNRNSSRAVTEA